MVHRRDVRSPEIFVGDSIRLQVFLKRNLQMCFMELL
jgi:hypothetical protein